MTQHMRVPPTFSFWSSVIDVSDFDPSGGSQNDRKTKQREVYAHTLAIIARQRPVFFIIQNLNPAKTIPNHDQLVQYFHERGYFALIRGLDPQDYSIPTCHMRTYIMGVLAGSGPLPALPEGEQAVVVSPMSKLLSLLRCEERASLKSVLHDDAPSGHRKYSADYKPDKPVRNAEAFQADHIAEFQRAHLDWPPDVSDGSDLSHLISTLDTRQAECVYYHNATRQKWEAETVIDLSANLSKQTQSDVGVVPCVSVSHSHACWVVFQQRLLTGYDLLTAQGLPGELYSEKISEAAAAQLACESFNTSCLAAALVSALACVDWNIKAGEPKEVEEPEEVMAPEEVVEPTEVVEPKETDNDSISDLDP